MSMDPTVSSDSVVDAPEVPSSQLPELTIGSGAAGTAVVDPAYQSPVPPLYHWAEKKREKNKYTHIFNL